MTNVYGYHMSGGVDGLPFPLHHELSYTALHHHSTGGGGALHLKYNGMYSTVDC